MAISNHWSKRKKAGPWCSVCTAPAAWGLHVTEDGMTVAVTTHYCDFCKQRVASAKSPARERPRPFHNDYGHANSDPKSLTQSSIPRWAEKIRTREREKRIKR